VARFPGTPVADSLDRILEDRSLALVAGAAIPSERCDLGLQAQRHGKHYFADKTPFTSLEQLERARQSVAQTRLKWGDHVLLITQEKKEYIPAAGKTGFPFFGEFVLDCLNGTESSMTQEHVFKAAGLCLEAQSVAVRVVARQG
jgi:hypothetical protein